MATEDQDDTNEILAATRAAKERREGAGPDADKPNHWPMATISLGIGSAAVVAALLYANRNRKK